MHRQFIVVDTALDTVYIHSDPHRLDGEPASVYFAVTERERERNSTSMDVSGNSYDPTAGLRMVVVGHRLFVADALWASAHRIVGTATKDDPPRPE